MKTKYCIFIILLCVCNSRGCYILSTDRNLKSPSAPTDSICKE